jgi:hypothetical protein
MSSSGMCGHVGLVRTDVSEERIVSIFRMERIHELGSALAVTIRLNHTEDGGDTFLRKVCYNKSHTAPHRRRRRS